MRVNDRVFGYAFGSIYDNYVAKVERKGRTTAELDDVLSWLTGYDADGLAEAIADQRDLKAFFAQAPAMNPNTSLIKGVICGYRVEDITDPLMQQIRWMDKVVDELAKGKAIEKIKRS